MSTRCKQSRGSAAARRVGAQLNRFPVIILFITFAVLAWGLIALAGGHPVENPSIPIGTILPVRLDDTISLKDAQRGQAIAAKIAQDVPLNRDKIPAKSAVKGSIISVEKDSDGPGIKLTLKFNQMESRKETLTMVTYLRAMASYNAVRAAQTPRSGADVGTPTGWADTVQIGGDIRYGDGGAVRNRAKQKVGKGVNGGVLVDVRANSELGCDGIVNGDVHPQALWVFSSDACGVYDLKGTKITHTGKGAPVGEITLYFEKEDAKLEGGTAMLLRVTAQP
jgi:hypothetical protein